MIATGDTWAVTKDFQCVNATNNADIPQEECLFGPTYDVPTSMEYVSDQTFSVQYGTGIALGKVGYENVTLGGITFSKQKVGIVDRSTDKGDGLNSGILSLGYPPLTSAYYGTKLANDSLLFIHAVYDPLFTSMHRKGLSSHELADEINAEFIPPAVYNEEYGIYVVNCDAETPALGIEINDGVPASAASILAIGLWSIVSLALFGQALVALL
ncbi:hypothetical protein QQZ08_001395 [Neonectria magnoliae]|uniref:Peptidase A1 domain-containing protein n=1 Tax=Neonectria magnoliae TaxID=2732573 RepID=A0ABR1IEN5_9HYPO